LRPPNRANLLTIYSLIAVMLRRPSLLVPAERHSEGPAAVERNSHLCGQRHTHRGAPVNPQKSQSESRRLLKSVSGRNNEGRRLPVKETRFRPYCRLGAEVHAFVVQPAIARFGCSSLVLGRRTCCCRLTWSMNLDSCPPRPRDS